MTCVKNKAIAEARSWIGTPYHHRARVKGVGCDCLMLVVMSYIAAGLVPADVEIPDYPMDVMFHSDDSRYVDGMLGFCEEVDGPPEPGDVVMWKFGKIYSHGAVVTAWPMIVHAYAKHGQVLEMSYEDDSRLRSRPMRIFRPREV